MWQPLARKVCFSRLSHNLNPKILISCELTNQHYFYNSIDKFKKWELSGPETEGDSGVGVGGEDGRKRVDATMSWMLMFYCCCCYREIEARVAISIQIVGSIYSCAFLAESVLKTHFYIYFD